MSYVEKKHFRKSRVLYRMLIFSIVGPFFEVFLSAWITIFDNELGNTTLHGRVSLFMMPVWSLMGCLLPIVIDYFKKNKVPYLVRVIVYMFCFLLIEYISGWFYRLIGIQVWDYSMYKYHLHGLICLEYSLPWFLVCCLAEYVYYKADAIAWILSRGITTKELEQRFGA